MIPAFIDRELVPHKPGIYQYKDRSGKIIYVGKAIDLYHRVASYFVGNHDPKTTALIDEIVSVETIVVESELEALILEANLIKKYLPKFNVRLVDDKDYLYIKITKEPFPRVITARKHDLKGSLKYFGPFPSSRTVKDTLKRLRRVFPWCQYMSQVSSIKGQVIKHRAGFLDNGTTLETTISRGSEVIAKTGQRSCFYYHLGLCPGACIGKISQADYRKNIFRLAALLDGKREKLVEDLIKEMTIASKKQDFEEAAKLKTVIEGINYLTQSNRTQVYLENPNFLEDQRQLALEELQKVLGLSKIPERIEGYDISNIQGHQSTGSMVVLTNGEIDKSQYRKFKIKLTGKPNDVGMHQEMMKRRLKHLEWPLPDLMIIDGGLGQVRAANSQVLSTKYKVPIFGLAKRQEWLYTPEGTVIKLPRKSAALKLVQKLRDESHRFAITYHRKLRNKAFLLS